MYFYLNNTFYSVVEKIATVSHNFRFFGALETAHLNSSVEKQIS